MVIDQAIQEFQLPNNPAIIQPFGAGHLHDSFLLRAKEGPAHILQRINEEVFSAPLLLGKNRTIITAHLSHALKEAALKDKERRCLKVIPTHKGEPVFAGNDGSYWRIHQWISEVEKLETVATPLEAYQAAKAFGVFHRMLLDISLDSLAPIFPNLHDLSYQYDQLNKVVKRGAKGRFQTARQVLDMIIWTKSVGTPITQALKNGLLPQRAVHNTPKINHVLLDKKTGEGMCVVGIDTVMAGTVLYDFGEMVRTFCCAEMLEDRKCKQINFRLAVFEALSEGYLSEGKTFLVPDEYQLLVSSTHYMTLLAAVRFLTDYLQGDKCYKVTYPNQNLDRCRNQLILLEQLLEHQGAMEKIVEKLMSGSQ